MAAAIGATAMTGGAASAATFQVTNNDDAGAGSLRQAIVSANANPDADVVTFAPTVVGSIVLGGTDINITNPVDIQGPGADDLAIDGDDTSRIFNIDGSGVSGRRIPVTISGLTLTGGDESTGGAVYGQYTSFTLSNSVVSGNYSTSGGAGLYLDSAVVSIANSEISSNRSDSGGGGVYIDGDSDFVNPGTGTDTVTIADSVLKNNRANGSGGALYVDNSTDGEALIVRSTIAGNAADGSGGGILFYGHRGASTIRQSTISGNNASDAGGGVYFDSDYAGVSSPLLVENSTLSGNRADDGGGGVYVENSENKPVSFLNSTIAGNVAGGEGGGIYRHLYDVTLSSTIVADNVSVNPAAADLAQDPGDPGVFTAGNSLIEASAGVLLTEAPAGSNVLGVDPALGALADNDGPTRTRLPAATSPVIDKGVANGLATDQRGLKRTSGAGTDIGSVELQDTQVTGATASAPKTQKFKKAIKVKVKVGASENVAVTAAGSIKAKKSYPLKAVTKNVNANQTQTLTLKPKKKSASKKIAKLLESKGKKASAKVSLSVSFTDSDGNTASKDLKTKLQLKAKKKK